MGTALLLTNGTAFQRPSAGAAPARRYARAGRVSTADSSATFTPGQRRPNPSQVGSRTRSTTARHLTGLDLPDTSSIAATLSSASTYLSTIDGDIASIPDNEFRKVFAGGGLIMLGSILSVVFVGFLIDSSGSYADLVADTYVEQNLDGEEETFLDSLGMSAEKRAETEEMIRAFREKKMRKAGTWTDEDEKKKQEILLSRTSSSSPPPPSSSGETEDADMFNDY